MASEHICQPVCAHLRVTWLSMTTTDGGFYGWWACAGCGLRFSPIIAPPPSREATTGEEWERAVAERPPFTEAERRELMAGSFTMIRTLPRASDFHLAALTFQRYERTVREREATIVRLTAAAEARERELRVLRDSAGRAARVLEALRISVQWELAPSIMEEIRDLLPPLRAALTAAPEESDEMRAMYDQCDRCGKRRGEHFGPEQRCGCSYCGPRFLDALQPAALTAAPEEGG